jgi:elongation factor P
VVIASELRDGMAVRIEGQVFKVLEVEVKAGGGQLGGVVKTKLRNVSSGRLWEPHFRPDERLEDLELDRQAMEFIYSDADNCVFMNQNTYEQIEVPAPWWDRWRNSWSRECAPEWSFLTVSLSALNCRQ